MDVRNAHGMTFVVDTCIEVIVLQSTDTLLRGSVVYTSAAGFHIGFQGGVCMRT